MTLINIVSIWKYPQIVIDIVDTTRVGPPLLPALRKVLGTGQVTQVVHYSIVTPAPVAIS